MPPRRTRGKSKEEPEQVEVETQPLKLTVHWDDSESFPITFANHVFVRLQDDIALVSFGQVELPREVPLSEETRNRMNEEGLPVQTVARLALPVAKISDVIRHLSTIYEIWQRQNQLPEVSDATES